MHDSLVISSNGEESVSGGGELGTDNMLRVASVASWVGSWAAWVVPQGDQTEVVSSHDEGTIWGGVDTVDVGAVNTLWPDASDVPGDLDSVGSPLSSLSV